MTVRQAAKRIGCHPSHIRLLIGRGVLRARKVKTPETNHYRWEVHKQDVARYAAVPQRQGWPRGQSRK